MTEPYIGQIDLFPYTFVPLGYAACDGSRLLIGQQGALYSLIQTLYGGDGKRDFAVPDLVGRAAVSTGQTTSGQQSWGLGTKTGTTDETITFDKYPPHSHTPSLLSIAATKAVPEAGLAITGITPGQYYGTPTANINTIFSPQSVTYSTGQTTPHTNMQPYVTLRPCIATDGIYPIFS